MRKLRGSRVKAKALHALCTGCGCKHVLRSLYGSGDKLWEQLYTTPPPVMIIPRVEATPPLRGCTGAQLARLSKLNGKKVQSVVTTL
jgi:hypothetical protein